MTTTITHGPLVISRRDHFAASFFELIELLLRTTPVHTHEWQAMDTSASPRHATHELLDVTVRYPVPITIRDLQNNSWPDLPWAEDHFAERVSGIPHNPPPSAARWPWAVRGNADHMRVPEDPGDDMADIPRFDHTYPERYWPKHAACVCGSRGWCAHPKGGLRFDYGDLSDVVNLLVRSRLTRQAYLPVWFPEDTGAAHGQRVPCTLGYHFMIRDGYLHCWYAIRSCDILRHFRNDVYMTARLMQWVAEQVNLQRLPGGDIDFSDPLMDGFSRISPGPLVMQISSLHAFVGDVHRLKVLSDAQIP